jgi:hypothetical protein
MAIGRLCFSSTARIAGDKKALDHRLIGRSRTEGRDDFGPALASHSVPAVQSSQRNQYAFSVRLSRKSMKIR